MTGHKKLPDGNPTVPGGLVATAFSEKRHFARKNPIWQKYFIILADIEANFRARGSDETHILHRCHPHAPQ
jgi:hypothetical protein